ncbi:PR domain zinc finger protein 5-like [Folsomia candida]|uniref:PR domain zinc finger protein 5-like n=1 Tax=Folsomia candida TaxID=158441 RepID=UPI001605145E|nr:PR domain zinc finger protein 5-like [Folsomia candida]
MFHVIRHDQDAKVKCEVCGKISKHRCALSAHMRKQHSNRKRLSCDTCHRLFSTSDTLRQHIRDVHGTMERPRFPCTVPSCGKTYQHMRGVWQHVKLEHAENPVRYPCTLCGKEFKRKDELELHIPTHTTEKPYNCATCGRSFAHVGGMKRHEITHSEKSTREVLKCHLCPQTLLTRRGLRSHVQFVHENRRDYPCAFCEKRFATRSDLKRHVEARHAVKKEPAYSCDKCEYKSRSEALFFNR